VTANDAFQGGNEPQQISLCFGKRPISIIGMKPAGGRCNRSLLVECLHALPICALLAALLSTPSDAQAAGRIPWTTSRVVGSPNTPSPFQTEPAFPNLKFKNPVDATLIPGTDQMLVLEQGGKLYSFKAAPDAGKADVAFDFKAQHQPFLESYSIAFHPRFKENGYIFVCSVEPTGRTNGSYISRFKMTSINPPVIDPASEKVFLTWLSGGHNGCTLAFGNDGFLYISTGDAASPDPPDFPYRTGQDISDLLASVLRIDVDRTSGTNQYAIPADNPFVKTPGARPEVYAFGFRNPWRMSFDRPTGDLWVGDVGWEQWEMIHRVKSGGNYGWSIIEGPNTHVRTDVKQGPGPILPAVVSLPHTDAASITGGLVYHGKKLPKLRGSYVYGDWETGKFWALRHNRGRLVSNEEICATTLKPVTFTVDPAGELLILDYNGGFHRLIPNAAPPANLALPRRLGDSGLFSDVAKLTPAPGVEPYRISAGMWNDFGVAEHVLGVPGDGAISSTGGRQIISGRMWFFPSNTVFARTLSLDMERGRPSSRKRIETQLMHFDGRAWNAYTYRWNATQTDADLVPREGLNDQYTVADPAAPGGHRVIPWRFGSASECFRCHNAWAGETLSFNWMQLSTPGGVTELTRLEELGVLKAKNPSKPQPRLVDPYDASLAVADRARSWLHVNCGTCHRFGAGSGVPSQFNLEQSVAQSRAYDVAPVRGTFGITGAKVIASGDPFRSTLFYRVSTEGAGRMPHIGSRIADESGLALLRDWIRTLPAKPESDPEAAVAAKLTAENTSAIALCRTSAHGEAVAKLLGTTSGALALLDETMSASTLPAFRREVATAALAQTNSIVRDLFQRLLAPEERRRTLGNDFDPRAVLALKGDAARGRALFHLDGGAQCARCHRVAGEGRNFGPDLTEVHRKHDSRAQILEHIIHPSKEIAPEFKTVMMTLRDGSELSGFALKRTANEWVLRDENLVEHKIMVAEVRESRESSLSAMPEGLLAPLTAQEAADLVEYLTRGMAKR
jgi:putative heme-binding domain-containing protein